MPTPSPCFVTCQELHDAIIERLKGGQVKQIGSAKRSLAYADVSLKDMIGMYRQLREQCPEALAALPDLLPPDTPVGGGIVRLSIAGAPMSDRRSHVGASQMHRSLEAWRPPLRSADGDSLRDIAILRARARDLYRNHPYARQAVRASSIGVIGKRLRYSCRPDHRYLGIDADVAIRWGQEFERVFDTYAHGPGFYCDAGRRLTFTQLMRLAHHSRFVDGEALATLEWRPDARYRTCLQLVDVDRLSTPAGAVESAYLRAGVEMDGYGAPIAYHIRHSHPSDVAVVDSRPHIWHRIERETPWRRAIVMHSYEVDRPGQTRGITMFAPTIQDMKAGREFTDLSLQQQTLQASYAAVLTSQQNYKDALEVIGALPADQQTSVIELAEQNLEAAIAYHEQAKVTIAGSSVPILYPGMDLKLLTPGNNAASLEQFMNYAVRSYSAGTGTDPIAVSQNYADVSYSAARMSQAINYRQYDVVREDLISQVAMPLVASFLEDMFHAGALMLPPGIQPFEFYDARDALVRGTFLTQGAPNLDPMKEAQALELEMRMGTATLQDGCAERGVDYLDVLDQQAREVMDREQRGLPPPGVPYAMMMQMQPPPSDNPAPNEG
jgi:lambda family phage portal protein